MSFYQSLKETATEFVLSTNPVHNPDGTISVDRTRMLAVRSPTFLQSWGPHYFAVARGFEQPRDLDGFITHMQGMLPKLEDWKIEIREVIVDEVERKASLRTYFCMTVKGKGTVEGRTVRNDVTWFLEMVDDGRQVEKATEYVDAGASTVIGEKIKAAAG